jgi:hypothetical protein
MNKSLFAATSEEPPALSSDWNTPIVLPDGRIYNIVKVEIHKSEHHPVEQSIVMRRCFIEVQGKHQQSTLRFEVKAYPMAFRRRLLDLRRPSTLVRWARQWIAWYLGQPHRHVRSYDHKLQADGSVVVECW